MDCSMPGFSVLHCLLEFAQTHVHWIGDAIQHLILARFYSCPQFFPASRSFPVSQFFTSSGQSIGASASVSVLLMNSQGWLPLGLTGLISLRSKGLSLSVSLSFSLWVAYCTVNYWLPRWLNGKESTCSAEAVGNLGLIPGSGRSPGGGNGNLVQYSCWDNPMDRGTWQSTLHGVTKNQTQLSTHTHCKLYSLCCTLYT